MVFINFRTQFFSKFPFTVIGIDFWTLTSDKSKPTLHFFYLKVILEMTIEKY